MSKPKSIQSIIKLVIKAGQAKPAPPVGPALGQAGLNLMSFCKDFNAKTADLKEDVPVPVSITAYTDKTFTYVIKTPPTTYFIKKALDLKAGSQKPGHQPAGELTLKHVLEIARVKQRDTPEQSLEALCSSVIGTARSMGISIAKPPPPVAV